jgi:hypothetical protein
MGDLTPGSISESPSFCTRNIGCGEVEFVVSNQLHSQYSAWMSMDGKCNPDREFFAAVLNLGILASFARYTPHRPTGSFLVLSSVVWHCRICHEKTRQVFSLSKI